MNLCQALLPSPLSLPPPLLGPDNQASFTLTTIIYLFTHIGNECKEPAPIDTQIYVTGSVNRHSPKTLDGFCYNIPQGKVTVGLSIGTCSGGKPGDAYTGWGSISRFVIEEMVTL